MTLVLTPQDKYCLQQLKASGLFLNIDAEKLHIVDGVIAVFCGDGDQSDDLYKHVVSVCRGRIADNRIHLVALNGGAILMSGQLGGSQNCHGETMFENVLDASRLKKMNDVFLYMHAPCGIVRAKGFGIVDQVRYLMMARDRLSEVAPRLHLWCFCHVDTYDEAEGATHKRRTYFVPRARWSDEALLPILHELKGVA